MQQHCCTFQSAPDLSVTPQHASLVACEGLSEVVSQLLQCKITHTLCTQDAVPCPRFEQPSDNRQQTHTEIYLVIYPHSTLGSVRALSQNQLDQHQLFLKHSPSSLPPISDTYLLSLPFHCLNRRVSVTFGSSENHSSLERGGRI